MANIEPKEKTEHKVTLGDILKIVGRDPEDGDIEIGRRDAKDSAWEEYDRLNVSSSLLDGILHLPIETMGAVDHGVIRVVLDWNEE